MDRLTGGFYYYLTKVDEGKTEDIERIFELVKESTKDDMKIINYLSENNMLADVERFSLYIALKNIVDSFGTVRGFRRKYGVHNNGLLMIALACFSFEWEKDCDDIKIILDTYKE